MKTLFYYKVAEHVFSLNLGSQGHLKSKLQQYEPFAVDFAEHVTFHLEVVDIPFSTEGFQEEIHQEDEGQEIIAGHLPEGEPCFEFWLGGRRVGVLISSKDYRQARVSLEKEPLFGITWLCTP